MKNTWVGCSIEEMKNKDHKWVSAWKIVVVLETKDQRGQKHGKWEIFCRVKPSKGRLQKPKKRKDWKFHKKKVKLIAPTYLLSQTHLSNYREDFLPVDPQTHHNFSQFLLHKGHFRHLGGQGSQSSLQRAKEEGHEWCGFLKMECVIALYLYDKLITKPLKVYILFYSFLLPFILSTF